MDYNTVRNKLVIPEYGRNLQKMVEYAISIEDREKRTRIANLIINVMWQLSPSSRDTAEQRHKLWDHLHVISDYRLDVDSPYPPPAREDMDVKPTKVKYPTLDIKYPHYGNNIKLLIDKAISLEDGTAKDNFVRTIANHMKKLYLIWNRDSVEDDVISQNLSEISQGQLKLSTDVRLNNTRDILQKDNVKKKFVPKPGRNQRDYKNKNRKRFQ